MTISRAEWRECTPSAPPRQECPPGQIRGLEGCVCPADKTLEQGRCVEPVKQTVQAPPSLEPCQTTEEVTVRGSSTVGLGVMPYLIQGFANARGFRVKRYDNDKHDIRVYQLQQSTQGSSCFQITVHASGSNDAGPALIDKTAQIGMSSRTYSDEEIKEIADSAGRRGAPRGEIERVVALDGVAIVVNRDNPVQSLSLCQIANIFSGKITDWRELRGDPGPIHLQIRRGASGTFETFQDLVLKKCKVELADGGARHQTYGRVLEEVENDRRSIGFAPFSLLTDKVRILDINGNCSVVQSLSKPSIKTEDYLLARRLFIFTPFRLGTHTRDFITFVSGDDRADAALTLQVPPSGDRQDLDIQRGAVDQKSNTLLIEARTFPRGRRAWMPGRRGTFAGGPRTVSAWGSPTASGSGPRNSTPRRGRIFSASSGTCS